MIQREGRAYRIGQKNKLTIFQMIVKDSVDEYVLKILNKKYKMSDSILGDSERLNKVKISKADINKLLK
jgi:SNF2 family DNA or RNA helicase